MPVADLDELMKLYARRGVAEWEKAPAERRNRAPTCLGLAIADDDDQAAVALGAIYTKDIAERFRAGEMEEMDSRFRYIPMPTFPKKTGIECSFFLPIREQGNDGRTTFDLFLIITGRNCIGFRFEPAHPVPNIHGYGHAQMCRALLRRNLALTLPSWLPDKYPAIPISTSNPLRMFLSMTTAMHGYQGGITEILKDIFQKANRAGEVGLYMNELNALLN
jgi:hypothetical protein